MVEAMALAAQATPSSVYLTSAQRSELVALYNADLKHIENCSGQRLPSVASPTVFERGAAPALEQASQEILSKFFTAVSALEFAARAPAAAARAKRLAAEIASRTNPPS